MGLFPISLLSEFVALLCAILFYLIKRNRLIAFFIPFLIITVSIESVGWFAKGWEYKFGLYNFFILFEFLFYTFLFYFHFSKKAFKKLALYFIVGFLVFCLINMMFIQGVNRSLNSYSSLIGSFFIVLFCCLFFYESILPDRIDKQLSAQPIFWISSGLLIFYLGSVIVNALFDYLTSNDLAAQGRRIYQIIFHSLNVLLYGSFCIAFYLCANNRKTSSSPS